MNTIDTSRIEIRSFSDSIEFLDKSIYEGEGSLFRFDQSGKLGMYSFMVEWPWSNFMILYDSNGNKQRLQPNEVIQWRFTELNSDSILRFTALLCAVDRNYGDLVLTAGSYTDSNIALKTSTFTKVICFKTEIPLKHFNNSRMIYVKGIREEKCTGIISSFVDSTHIDNL